jgi:hypothetical protein
MLVNSLDPPPPGPNPESRSGAITINPSAASSSAISLAQSAQPEDLVDHASPPSAFPFTFGIHHKCLQFAIAML